MGARTAQRYAFHLLKAPTHEAKALADAVVNLKTLIRTCEVCCMVSEGQLCSVCGNPERDRATVCIVEQPRDFWAMERLGRYGGTYHVLMGSVDLLDGIDLDSLSVKPLLARLKESSVAEVIIATNPTLEGETTALHLIDRLRGLDLRISRIARGVPAGSQLDWASRAVLEDALEGRQEVRP